MCGAWGALEIAKESGDNRMLEVLPCRYAKFILFVKRSKQAASGNSMVPGLKQTGREC